MEFSNVFDEVFDVLKTSYVIPCVCPLIDHGSRPMKLLEFLTLLYNTLYIWHAYKVPTEPYSHYCWFWKGIPYVGMKKERMDMLRFLWFDDPFGDDHITITLRFKRFMFGLRSSASILSNIISTCIGKVNQKWQSCSRKHSTLTIYYRERKLFGKCSRFTKGPMAAGGFNVENGTATQHMLWSESKKQNPTVEVGTIALFIRTVFLLFQISTTLNQATLLI